MKSSEDEKKSLRKVFLAKRRALLAGAQGEILCRAVQERLMESTLWKNAGRVALYVSLPDEISTKELLDEAWRSGKEVFLPRCRPGERGIMDMIACGSPGELAVSAMGIAEPVLRKDSRRLPEKSPDLLAVVPALAFDRQGFRLGYGGGYYDRFLASAGCVSVGLSLQALLADVLPHEPWDLAVTHVCTEEGLQCTQGS